MRSRRKWVLGGILAALSILVFWPVAGARFIDWDDWQLLTENPDFSPVSWHRIAGYWIHPYYQLYAPLSYTAWGVIGWFDQHLSGRTPLSAATFHLANLALHLAASEMVFLLLYRLVGRALPALAGGLVFALHPLQIEPVAWVASFNTPFSIFLAVTALWAYVHHAQAAQGSGKTKWLVLGSIFLLLALFAKPMALPTPAIALLIDALILRRSWRQYWLPIAIWTALCIPFIIAGRAAQPSYLPVQTALYLHPLIVADSFGFYLLKLFWPFQLTIDYQRTPTYLLQTGQIYFTWIFPAAIILLAWILPGRQPGKRPASHEPRWLLAGAAIMFAAILPTSGIAGFAFQRYSTVADRYMYFGMVGAALALAGIMRPWSTKSVLVCIFVLIPAYMLCDSIRMRDWRDTRTITANAPQVRLDCSKDHLVRAYALMRMGRDDEAITQYQLASHYDPGNADIDYNYADLLYRLGKRQMSLEFYRRAIGLQPGRADIHHNYAVALMGVGDTADAGREFLKATQLDPSSSEARMDYAKWQAMRKR